MSSDHSKVNVENHAKDYIGEILSHVIFTFSWENREKVFLALLLMFDIILTED